MVRILQETTNTIKTRPREEWKTKKEMMEIRHEQLKRLKMLHLKSWNVASVWKLKMNQESIKERKRFKRKNMQQKNEMKWKMKHEREVSGTSLHDYRFAWFIQKYSAFCAEHQAHSIILNYGLARHEFNASPFATKQTSPHCDIPPRSLVKNQRSIFF